MAKNKLILFCLISFLPFLFLYAKTPYEAEYLIPTIPFLLLFFNKIGTTRLFSVLCILLISQSAVTVGNIDVSNNQNIDIDIIGDGVISKKIIERNDEMELTQRIISSNITHSVFIVRTYFPRIKMNYLEQTENGPINCLQDDKGIYDSNMDRYYHYRLSEKQTQEYVSENYTIYYLKGIESKIDYDIKKYNAKPFVSDN